MSGRGSIAHVQYTGDENAAEIKKLLEAVVADEDSYDRWEPLIEKSAGIEGGVNRNSSPAAIDLVRAVYDCFLAKFPLYFAYWKKYADLEFGIGGTETAELVYERGVAAIFNSVQLWTDYCGFKMDTCHDTDATRELFERGAEFVGSDFHAHTFWTKYIEFEERNSDTPRLITLLERLQHFPQWAYVRYYERYRTLLATHHPLEEVTKPETLEKAKAQVAAENQGLPEKSDVEIDRAIRLKLDIIYYERHQANSAEVAKRWAFEEHIKRPYFHVTDIDEPELVNWRKYLDFEENEGDFKRIVDLHERCLMVCALHEEFWLRYARWMFAQGKDENARIIYLRASCLFVPIAHPTIRLHWARFEEKLGAVPIARDIHLAILEDLPENIETMISLAGLERRHEGVDAAVQCLQNFINQRGMPVAAKLTVEQARLLWQCGKAVDQARALFTDRVKQFPGSKDFWAGYLKFETSQVDDNDEESYSLVKTAYDLMREKGGFSPSDLKELSKVYLQYLLNRGGKKAAEEYMRLDKELSGALPISKTSTEAAAEPTGPAPPSAPVPMSF